MIFKKNKIDPKQLWSSHYDKIKSRACFILKKKILFVECTENEYKVKFLNKIRKVEI